MSDRLLKQTKRECSPNQRLALLAVEEREMVARFGKSHLAYRRGVPFITPRFR